MSEPASKSTGATADDVLQEITDRIIADLEKGVIPWRRPWRPDGMPLRHAGRPFTGTNRLILSLAADDAGYKSPYWLTEAQGSRCRGSVKDGEKGTLVLRPTVFGAHMHVPLMQPYEVFNAEQFDRLPPRFRHDPRKPRPTNERIPEIDEFVDAAGAKIRHDGDEAFYSRDEDVIQMPLFDCFDDSPNYYGTLAHEAVHWTGHESRMQRRFGGRFGDEAYAAEELVAELGAALLTHRFRLPWLGASHASYIGGWAKVLGGWQAILKGDKRAIYNVATHAQRAADYLAIAADSGRENELAKRPLDDRPWIVVYLDIVKIGSHPLVVAVGVSPDGRRCVLGMNLIEADPSLQRDAVNALLRDLVERGLAPERRRLFVTDGLGVLKQSVKDVFGSNAVIQACRMHCKREVLKHVTAVDTRARATTLFSQAWELGADGGPQVLAQMAGCLDREGYKKAADRLREGLDDLFTVDRYGLHPSLSRSLTTAHQIDRASSGLPRQICGVAKWPHARTALSWASSSFLATERGCPRIAGYRHLQELLDLTNTDTAVRPLPAQKAEAKEAKREQCRQPAQDTRRSKQARRKDKETSEAMQQAEEEKSRQPPEPVVFEVEKMSAEKRVAHHVPALADLKIISPKTRKVVRTGEPFVKPIGDLLEAAEQLSGVAEADRLAADLRDAVDGAREPHKSSFFVKTGRAYDMLWDGFLGRAGPKYFADEALKAQGEVRRRVLEPPQPPHQPPTQEPTP